MLSELISRFTCVCTYITVPSVCACLHLYMECVRGCVWFLYNIPNLSNLGPRCEALLFSWRSRWATKTVVHFGNRLKLWTSMKLSLSLLAELQVAVDVETACECESWHGRGRGSGATYHAKNGPIQAKAARQQKQFKCYCTFRLHVLAAAAAAAPIQCLIFRAVVFTPPSHSPFSSSFYTFFILVIVCVFLLACRASCELKTKVGEILSPSALSVKITLQVGATSIPLPPLLPLLHSLPAK